MTLTYTKPTPHQRIQGYLEDAVDGLHLLAANGAPRLAPPPAYTPPTLEGLLRNEQAEANGEPPPAPAVDPLANNYARMGIAAPPSIDFAAGNRERVQGGGQRMFVSENPLTLNNITPPPQYEAMTLEGLIANEEAARRATSAAPAPVRQRNPNEPPPYEAPVMRW